MRYRTIVLLDTSTTLDKPVVVQEKLPRTHEIYTTQRPTIILCFTDFK
jgi:hypothetical protein